MVQILATLLLATAATIAILLLRPSRDLQRSVSGVPTLDRLLAAQLGLAATAVTVLIVLHIWRPEALARYLGPGFPSAPVTPVWWLGLQDGDTWGTLGLSLAVFVSLGTAIFMGLRMLRSGVHNLVPLRVLPWILLLSLTNSAGEELVYRLGVVAPLADAASPGTILLISAVVFGAPHLKGMPNGLVGAAMAGFMGWLLAKSVVETGGLYWAWLIHCLQDAIILTAFAAMDPKVAGAALRRQD